MLVVIQGECAGGDPWLQADSVYQRIGHSAEIPHPHQWPLPGAAEAKEERQVWHSSHSIACLAWLILLPACSFLFSPGTTKEKDGHLKSKRAKVHSGGGCPFYKPIPMERLRDLVLVNRSQALTYAAWSSCSLCSSHAHTWECLPFPHIPFLVIWLFVCSAGEVEYVLTSGPVVLFFYHSCSHGGRQGCIHGVLFYQFRETFMTSRNWYLWEERPRRVLTIPVGLLLRLPRWLIQKCCWSWLTLRCDPFHWFC